MHITFGYRFVDARFIFVEKLPFCFKVILYSYLILKKMNERITDS